jgi:hypothetical protein
MPEIDCENSIRAAFSTGMSGATVATSPVMMSLTVTDVAATDMTVSSPSNSRASAIVALGAFPFSYPYRTTDASVDDAHRDTECLIR